MARACDTGLVEFAYIPEHLRDEMWIPGDRLRVDDFTKERRVILGDGDIRSMIEFVVKARGRWVLEQILGDPKLGPTVQLVGSDQDKNLEAGAILRRERIIDIIDRLTRELS